MQHKIETALISVFYKDGLEPIVKTLHEQGVKIYSTGGTQAFIESLGIACIPVEDITGYPSILGGRVKTLHPKVFGGILARRDMEEDASHVQEYEIPLIDLVIVDLYPFEETLKAMETELAKGGDAKIAAEKAITEKVDIGGPSMIRAAAKNHQHTLVVAAKKDYQPLHELLQNQQGTTTIVQRRNFAAKAFEVVAHYDVAIANYFLSASDELYFQYSGNHKQALRYGENPHQPAAFYGDIEELFSKLNGKELSYNNLVDTDAAVQIIGEFIEPAFAIIKHTNVCGIAIGNDVHEAWTKALAADPESAFGGVLITNQTVDVATATAINGLFFEILIAPAFDEDALAILKSKKNRIILQQIKPFQAKREFKRILNGVLVQEHDDIAHTTWEDRGARPATATENLDLAFANIVCKHLKSNAIALVKDRQLIGKGCGQTSRIDALKQAVEKAKHFGFSLDGASLASDAFFPFDDCARMAHEAGITALVQPGGSVRDADTVNYCLANNMALVMTGTRHFKH